MSFIKRFIPVFLVSFLLPFLLFYVINSPNLRFSSRANVNEVRVWFEPSSIVASPGEEVKVDIVAQVDNEEGQVFELSSDVISPQKIAVAPSTFTFRGPFGGKVVLASVTVSTTREGNFSVTLPQESIKIAPSDLIVKTSSLEFLVKR